jgi:hypothetical protein
MSIPAESDTNNLNHNHHNNNIGPAPSPIAASTFQQIKALIRKDIRINKRSKVQLLLQILVPLLTAILGGILIPLSIMPNREEHAYSSAIPLAPNYTNANCSGLSYYSCNPFNTPNNNYYFFYSGGASSRLGINLPPFPAVNVIKHSTTTILLPQHTSPNRSTFAVIWSRITTKSILGASTTTIRHSPTTVPTQQSTGLFINAFPTTIDSSMATTIFTKWRET